jgi:hypothetical protein
MMLSRGLSGRIAVAAHPVELRVGLLSEERGEWNECQNSREPHRETPAFAARRTRTVNWFHRPCDTRDCNWEIPA